MCGRFTLFSSIEELSRRFGFAADFDQIRPEYNVAPSQQVLVVTDHRGSAEAEFMRWGLIPHWVTRGPKSSSFINARIETPNIKPSFKSAFRSKRCLIITNGFYEWHRHDENATPYYFQLEYGQPFAFAGIWENWSDPQGNKVKSCAILTREATWPVKSIHSRMPAIVPPENEPMWTEVQLNKPSDIKKLLLGSPPTKMESWKVSDSVNSSTNNDSSCIDRT